MKMSVEAVGVMVLLNLNKGEKFEDIKCWNTIKL